MTDLLLTHSYFLHFDPKEERAMMPYPPLGTLYAASYLRHSGATVALFDAMLARSEEELLPSLDQHRPRVLVIYDDAFNYLTKMCLTRMRGAAQTMARMAKERGCVVVVFSSDASDHIPQYLDAGVDYVICGEGEATLAELWSWLRTNPRGTPDHIQGLAFRSRGTVMRTSPRPLIENLDDLLFPAWDLVDIPLYRSTWKSRHGYFSINMTTTRGCPFHCNWCAKPLFGQAYHSRSPENVVREMIELKRTINPDHIWFADDIFGLKPGWIQRFADVVNQEDAVLPFKCLSRVDLLLKGNTIPSLRRAGCDAVWVGAESGSQKVLDAMEKGTTVKQIVEATERLRSAGLRVGFFLQFGYPGEKLEDIELTLNMVRNCQPDDIGISVSYPLPGTPFYERVQNELGDKQNWVASHDLDLMFRGTYAPPFYRALHSVTHKRFRMWEGARMLRSIVREGSWNHSRPLRTLARSAYHTLTLPFAEATMRKTLAESRHEVSRG